MGAGGRPELTNLERVTRVPVGPDTEPSYRLQKRHTAEGSVSVPAGC